MLWSTIRRALIGTFTGLLLVSCNIQRPKLDLSAFNGKTAIFVHSGDETSCAPCHEKIRPAPVVTNGTSVAHGGGSDCVSCHLSNQPWRNPVGGVSHNPIPASCTGCHLSAKPSGPVPLNSKDQFDHALPGGQALPDCKQCHTAVAANVGVLWSGAVYGHAPAPSGCISCHVADRPTGIVQGFDHSNAAAQGDCKSCHLSTSVWTGGTFSHTPTPVSCNECHMARKPVGLVPLNPPATQNQFDHALSGLPDCKGCHLANLGTSWAGGVYSHSPTPNTCILCHTSDRPTSIVTYTEGGVQKQFNHAISGMGDCVSCHTGSVNWKTGSYSHSPKPTTCSGCHLNQRPTAPVNGFNHSIAGTGDCAACHWKSGTTPTWTGASFSHSTLSSTTRCDSCHLSSKPATPVPVGSPDMMDHTKIGTTDCRTCHTSVPANIGVSWNPGVYNHSPAPTTCMSCHINKRPATLVNGFNHSNFPTTDCATCHTVNVGINWTGARPHALSGTTTGSTLNCTSCHGQNGWTTHKLNVPETSHMGGTANSCISCHANFSAFKGNTTSTTAPILKYAHSATVLSNNCQICHQFTGTPATFKAYSDSTYSKLASANVTGTFDGSSKTFTHQDSNMFITISSPVSLTAQNCKACHQYKAYSATATTPASRWGYTHAANGVGSRSTTPGCKVCH